MDTPVRMEQLDVCHFGQWSLSVSRGREREREEREGAGDGGRERQIFLAPPSDWSS